MANARTHADAWRHVAAYYLGDYTDTHTPEECREEAVRRSLEEGSRVAHLERLVVHCEHCGADYAATGLEAGCPCLLRARVARLEEAIQIARVALDEYYDAHRDRESPDDNECDKAQCAWCDMVDRFRAALADEKGTPPTPDHTLLAALLEWAKLAEPLGSAARKARDAAVAEAEMVLGVTR